MTNIAKTFKKMTNREKVGTFVILQKYEKLGKKFNFSSFVCTPITAMGPCSKSRPCGKGRIVDKPQPEWTRLFIGIAQSNPVLFINCGQYTYEYYESEKKNKIKNEPVITIQTILPLKPTCK